jgi:ADP-heptose:LPS heptosyltransferase
MIAASGRVRLEVVLPRDRMIADRLRRSAHLLALAARGVALWIAGIARRRDRQPPHPSRVKRLLVVRTDRLGDMALTTAALMDLRDHFRKAEITVLAPAAPLALLEAHPAVDRRVLLTDVGLPPELVGRFDLAVDFTPDESLRGALLAFRSRARHRAGIRAWGRQACFTLKGPRADPRRHVLDLNRELIVSLGAAPRATRPVLQVTPDEMEEARSRLAALGTAAPRVAVHPGGRFPTQRWAPERFAEVISGLTGRVGATCLVLAGPGEESLVERIVAATPDALAVGPLPVRGMMSLIAACDLLIGGNSGPLHVAGALGVPTISVMGPTDPARFAPRGPADRVVRRDLPCSPCGRGRCWHHTCLRTIEPEDVLAEAEATLRTVPLQEAAR